MNLDKIGIELELNVGNYRDYYNNGAQRILSQIDPRTQSTSKGNPEMGTFIELPWRGIKVQLTDEYYSSQCEWKIFPEPLEKLPELKQLMLDIVSMTRGTITHNKIPEFIGTHIHLFFKENKKDITSFVRGKTILSAFLMEYFYYFFKELDIPNNVKCKELERLCFNHNILQKLDYKLLNKGIRKNLNTKGFDYYYTNLPKSKYQPVHWSNPNNGKPLTLELRYIPNSFFQYASVEIIHDFITTVEDKVGYINSLSQEEFQKEHEQNKEQCIFWHSQLLEQYLECMAGKSFEHLPVYAQSNNPSNISIDNINFEKYYLQAMRYNNSHKRAFSSAKQEVLKQMNNFVHQKSTIITNKEELLSILNHVYIDNMESMLERCMDAIRKPWITFAIKSIKDITKTVPGLYTAVASMIDEEWDERLALEPSQSSRTRDMIANIQHNPQMENAYYTHTSAGLITGNDFIPNQQFWTWVIQLQQELNEEIARLRFQPNDEARTALRRFPSNDEINQMIGSSQFTARSNVGTATIASLENVPF